MKVLTSVHNESTSYAVNLSFYTESGNRLNPIILPLTEYLYAGSWVPVDPGNVFIKKLEGVTSTVTYKNPSGLISIKTYKVTDVQYKKQMKLLESAYTRSILFDSPILTTYKELQIYNLIIPDALKGSICKCSRETILLGGYIPANVITIGGEITFGEPSENSAYLGGWTYIPKTSTATLGGRIPETASNANTLLGHIEDTLISSINLSAAVSQTVGGEDECCFTPWVPYVRTLRGFTSNTDYLVMYSNSSVRGWLGAPAEPEPFIDRWTGRAKCIQFIGGWCSDE